jgi:hypothetical protein
MTLLDRVRTGTTMQPIPDPPPWTEPAAIIPEPIALTDDQLLRIARAILRHTVEHKLGGLYPTRSGTTCARRAWT